MTDAEPRDETPPALPAPASDPDPGDLHAASHAKVESLEDQVEGMRDELTRVYERLDQVESSAPAAEPERTEVVPRTDEAPKEEVKPDEPPPAASGDRHTGLFI